MTESKTANQQHRRFLDPTVLARIQRLDLVAKFAVEGFIAGLHRSPYHGFSAEFSEHRQYIPGDPIKHVDWRVLARTNRLYLKQFEDETNLQAYIVLDCSGTMGYGAHISKWIYARMVAASLMYLFLRQRDSVGLVLFNHALQKLVPARSVPGHLDVLLRELAAATPSDTTNPVACLHLLAERIKRRSLIVVISDFLLPSEDSAGDNRSLDEMANDWDGVLKHFRHNGHDVTALAIQNPDEVDFTFKGIVEFLGLEGEASIQIDTSAIAHLYREQFNYYMSHIERSCRNAQVDYHRLLTTDSLGNALAMSLDKRRRLR